MRRRIISPFIAYGVFLLLAHGPAFCQTSFGVIVGTVSDSSHAVIPGVALTVTNMQTGISRQLWSDKAGDFRVESLLPGEYIIKAQHPGFRTTEIKNVQVPVAVTVTVNVVLEVGPVVQSIEVTATPPLLESANATVGTVVNNTSVVTLPLDGRNFTELIGLIPGAVNAGAPYYMVSGGANYSVGGNRAEQNNFTLDGAYNNEEFFKQFAIQPSIDAIQEFKIQTNITSAEFGQAAGANVNVATKSGTNQLHGSAFEFLRNDKLDANDWFRNASNIPRPAYKRNQYGGVIGGPVYIPHLYNGRDKSFWLFNYEGSKVRRGSTIAGLVPTLAQWAGDLRDQPPIYDPLTTRQVGTDSDGNPFFARDQISCNGRLNVICPERIDPWIKAYADVMYPMISAPPGAHSVQTVNTKPFTVDQYQWTLRADQKLREDLSFFARMSLTNGTQTTQQQLPVLSNYLINRMRNFVASWTLAANPTTVIDWKISYSRTNLRVADSNPAPGWEAFLAAHPISGTPVKNSRLPLYPQVGLADFSSAVQSGALFVTNIYQALGSLAKIRGRHSVRAGVEFTDVRNMDDGLDTSGFGFGSLVTADPQNMWTTGSALASYLLGLPSGAYRNLGETAAYMRQERWHFYAQDDIKVSRRLTLNAGLRYEYSQWPVDRWNRIAGFDPTTPPHGAYLWAGYNPILKLPPNVRRSFRDPDFNNFAPRFGLALQLAPKTTFRSGYGIFYVSNYLWEDQGSRGTWPYAISESYSANFPSTLPENLMHITTFFGPETAPGPNSTPSSIHVLGRLDRTGYVQQWNAGLQRQLTSALLLELDYVGSRGVKQALYTNLNTALPGPGPVGTPEHPRIYGNSLGSMLLMTNQGSSIYHALQVKLEKRFSRGLQFLSSYAWGKEIDIGGSCFSCSQPPQNPFDWKADRASGTFDYRHVWSFNYFYQLPFGRGNKYLSNANKVTNGLAGGWEFTGIAHYNSGGPINVYFPGDVANIGGAVSQRPDRVIGQPQRAFVPGERRLGWINLDGYSTPAPYTFGNAGRNTERGPGSGYWNVGLLKNFPLASENRSLQFRAESFNLLNHASMGCIFPYYALPDFGTSFCATATREIQFGLKFLF